MIKYYIMQLNGKPNYVNSNILHLGSYDKFIGMD